MITKQDKHGVVRLVAFVRGKCVTCITESGRYEKHYPSKSAAKFELKRIEKPGALPMWIGSEAAARNN
jgi:hypothetical protein